MVNFGLLATEIGPVVWGTPATFNGLRVLAALLPVILILVNKRLSICTKATPGVEVR